MFKCRIRGKRKTTVPVLLLLCLCFFAVGVFWFETSLSPSQLSELQHIYNAVETFDFMQKLRLGKLPTTTKPVPAPVRWSSCWFRQPEQPKPEEILVSNELWQQVKHTTRDTFLFSANFDARPETSFSNSIACVRVLAMVKRYVEDVYYCQLWFNRKHHQPAIVVRAHVRTIWERGWDPRNPFYVPILITCPIPEIRPAYNDPPEQVSIAVAPCTRKASTLLPVNYVRLKPGEDKKFVAVCVKGMDFWSDSSKRLVEWIEANLLFGVDKISFYTYEVHPNIARVLAHYERIGKADHQALTLPGNAPNAPSLSRSAFIKRNRQQKRRNELIPYNDCLYRHLHTHRFVLNIDVDELIVPFQDENYAQLIDRISGSSQQEYGWTALSAQNAFFFDNLTNQNAVDGIGDIPRYMHMLRHPVRSARISTAGSGGKSFVYIDNVVTVFNHFALHKYKQNLRRTYFIPVHLALKNHYKEVCPIEWRDECPHLFLHTEKDNSLQKYSTVLLKSTQKVLKKLNII